ncbi:hypothetical protein CcaverHIS002_0113180 [Cutaneotrichosporon cavernicola]|uniref:Zn(2)-C6 fungal-type domain-containing protein n=1 Tax=Cutaneotrichosporon cavernicola TaxID=279322 RepID=A0AA48I3B7_9TREE|nr:uncharacterized protein CcaverHIS019_0113050 [Cutaneotrichosporon cavernicola]BEI80789.1 hypothetical protein CcaverHIS002_0113180 [Cutaneotrichosporon cavernicola]BEI88587.1 hypothetical protein CcaverHIS019_0113050 [Cutaneotrichosporon cavernicola]BEI96360.1 hypothetical protein CcaverHIS631_0113090 [Cutaneotrichosporon cavernicola]BEJ04132.1 hypothetical protein CcaverHIS641_0113070 [Cutaneotrichosporon cavernicola]
MASASDSPLPSGYGAKRKRISRACDRCNKLGRKCLPGSGNMCQSCVDYGDNCTYDRPMGKRGAPPKAQRMKKELQRTLLPDGLGHEQILHLVNAWYTAVYPIYHYFSWRHYAFDVHEKRYEHDAAFRSTVLVMCAIAAARIRDGAYQPASGQVAENDIPVDPDVLRAAAVASLVPMPPNRPLEFEDLRAASLIHVLGQQNGDIELVQLSLARYHGIAACFKFHDERFWPPTLEEWQREERRALFWSTYTSDVFISLIWGGMIMHRASQCHVKYPSWRLDEHNTSGETHWIVGWNTVTDLYRILHRIIETEEQQKGMALTHPPELPLEFAEPTVSIATAWPAVRALVDALPAQLRECAPLSGDVSRDIYSYTAANLLVTLQAVRMAIACAGPLPMQERCAVAGELLDTLSRIPTAYMQGISVPFVHQLGAVGSLLGGVVQGPLTVSAYIHVRQILLTLGNILSHLESSLKCSGGIAERLFDHVARIDTFMQAEASGRGQELLQDAIHTHRIAPKAESTPTVPLTAHLVPSPQLVTETSNHPSITPSDQEMFTLPDDLLQDWLFPQDQALFDSLFRGQG